MHAPGLNSGQLSSF